MKAIIWIIILILIGWGIWSWVDKDVDEVDDQAAAAAQGLDGIGGSDDTADNTDDSSDDVPYDDKG